MPNPSYTSSSDAGPPSRAPVARTRRWLRSGLLWSALAVAGLELWLGRALPGRFFRHEVDELLYQLDTRTYHARTLSLGNSVGRQLDRGIARLEPGFLEPMASNGSLETTGQYLLLRRYLERNPAPENLVLLLDNPFAGSLQLIYTENYIQRCFLRWREIAQLAWWRGSPVFTMSMIAYKLLPSFRYRMDLQLELPFLDVTKVYLDLQNADRAQGGVGKPAGAFSRAWQRLVLGPEASISSVSFERMLALCQARGIRVYLVPTPMRESEFRRRSRGVGRSEINARLAALQQRYPCLRYLPDPRVYPDAMFPDTSHFAPELVPLRAKEHLDVIKEMMARDAR
jgi:hypothetical protein